MLIENARLLFQIPKDVTYLNCANMAPQLKAVTEAGLGAVRAKESPWKLTPPEWFSGAETLRALAARVLHVDGDGIALVPAVSYGIAVAAANLPISRQQTIVLIDQEFPANVYAWREVARKTGCHIRTASAAVTRHGQRRWKMRSIKEPGSSLCRNVTGLTVARSISKGLESGCGKSGRP